MFFYIVLFFVNSFLIYQSLTALGVLGFPHVAIINPNNMYVQVFKLVLVKWGIVLGIIGALYSLLGVIVLYKDDKYNAMRNGLFAFYFVILILSLI